LVALLEALKGVIVLCAGFGVLSLLHRDLERIAVALVTRLHIDPYAHYAGIFIEAAAHTTDARLLGVAALALVYSVLRLCEAYGLWFDHRWGLWFGVASGAIYVPVELYELWHRPGLIKVGALVVNLAVIAYLVLRLRRESHEPGAAAAGIDSRPGNRPKNRPESRPGT